MFELSDVHFIVIARIAQFIQIFDLSEYKMTGVRCIISSQRNLIGSELIENSDCHIFSLLLTAR